MDPSMVVEKGSHLRVPVLKKIVSDPERVFDRLKEELIVGLNAAGRALNGFRRVPFSALRFVLRSSPRAVRRSIEWMTSARPLAPLVARGPRWYVPEGMTRETFIAKLHERGVRYVVLRWWEDFPEFPDGEDMDILVEDADVANLTSLLVRHKSNIPCDIYTVHGSNDGDYRGLPYFAPGLARRLIAERVLYRARVFVPPAELYFASLAYHALYHKGIASGLWSATKKLDELEHDYPQVLKRVGVDAGITVETNVHCLHKWLSERGLAPEQDTLRKLSVFRPELSVLLPPSVCDVRGGELGVFLIRERAEIEGLTPSFMSLIERKRMEVVLDVTLDETERQRAGTKLRGGKWDKGPYPVSGGGPARLVGVYDYYPKPPSVGEAMSHPGLTNRRFLELKQDARGILDRKIPFFAHYNPLHSSDNESEAWGYIQNVVPEELQRVWQKVEVRRRLYHTRYPIERVMSEGRRSKTELIRFGDGLAVKKTFRPGFERFLNRELLAAEELSRGLSFVPRLLEKGEGYLITPYYENILAGLTKRQMKKVLYNYRHMLYTVIRELYSRGLTLIDFKPQNIIITSIGQFYVIDYEFLQRYEQHPLTIDEAFEVRGISRDFAGDLPNGFGPDNSSFDTVWAPYVGSWKSVRQATDEKLQC